MSPEHPSSDYEETPSTPKMSVPGSPIALTPYRGAQSPISMLLAVAQSQKSDDDLTSLNWLHEKDVLKGMNVSINTSPLNGTNTTPTQGTTLLTDQSPTSDYVDDSSINSTPESSICNASIHSPQPAIAVLPAPVPPHYQCRVSSNVCQNVRNRSRHPQNVPYDPQIHITNKPPYSFSCLIFMAIEDSTTKALPVKEIYAWIVEHFPYFQNAPTGWKNSVRHNLSLNKCFQKVEKAPNLGKGSLWTVDPQFKPNLIQALNRSPFYPCSVFDVSKYVNLALDEVNHHQSAPEVEKNRVPTMPNPELFPFLSRKLAGESENSAQVVFKNEDSLDEVDAAAVMLSLKHGCSSLQQIITNSPSQDHTYSAADSLEEQDEAFLSDEDKRQKNKTCRKIDFEDEEQRRIKEGAETLLNLAGIKTRKRSAEYTDWDSPSGKMYREDFELDSGIKCAPFKPRLLTRAKRKSDCSPQKLVFNNNNDNEWMRNRQEMGIDLSTRTAFMSSNQF